MRYLILILTLASAPALAQGYEAVKMTALKAGTAFPVEDGGAPMPIKQGRLLSVVGMYDEYVVIQYQGALYTVAWEIVDDFDVIGDGSVFDEVGDPDADVLAGAPPPVEYDGPIDMSRWEVAFEVASAGVYFDTTTIERTGTRRKAWVWWAYRAPQEAPGLGKLYDRAIIRTEYDCTSRRVRSFDHILYRYWEAVHTYSAAPTEWASWIPETDGEYVAEAVCAYRP